MTDDEFLAVARKATPGEWEAVLWGDHVRIQAKNPSTMGMIVGRTYGDSLGDRMDADYIAAANPADSIARIERHRAEAERLTKERDEYKDDYFRRHKDACDRYEEIVVLKDALAAERKRVGELETFIREVAHDDGRRETVTELNAFPFFSKLNRRLVELRSKARAALAGKEPGNG